MRMKDAWKGPICKGIVMLMWRLITVPVNMCPLSLPKSGSNGVLFVRLYVISGSWWVRSCVFVLKCWPGSGFRLELEPEIVEIVATAVLPAALFVVGPHQRVEH
eukprot:2942011-Amphidinium_carterae.1